MKALILVTVLVVTLIQSSDSRHLKTKRSLNIYETISNKTNQFKTYIREKGRSLKHFYSEQVKRIPFVGDDNSIIETVDDKLTKMKKKLSDYIDKAEKKASTLLELITSDESNTKCVENNSSNTMTTLQMITIHGYDSEAHTVMTEDGYLLTVHRIPYSKDGGKVSRKTILLHHGLLGSSADWVIPGPKKALPYILSDAGYDVWMANVRGNTYSRAHVSRTVDSEQFWDFSFHEVGQYDLPAVIDYIVKKKGNDLELSFIGFSMGTSALFALLSTKTEYNHILRAGYALAPVTYMSQIKTPFKLLSTYGKNIGRVMKLLGANEFLPRNAVLKYLSKHSCKVASFEEAICEISMFTLCGYSKEQFDISMMPLIFGHVPAGASTKTLVHYAQEIRNGGSFQHYDYGIEGNRIRYGADTPPQYPVKEISLPIALLSAEDDWISSLADAQKLYGELPNPIEHYIVPLKDFNHLDFLFARDAPTLVYDKLMELLRKQNIHETNYF